MTTVHPTAIVDPAAELAASVTVGPYAVIGAQVRIGEGTTVGAVACGQCWEAAIRAELERRGQLNECGGRERIHELLAVVSAAGNFSKLNRGTFTTT